jgi:tetratricopeptide (TPR) repeat protein
MIGIVFLKSMHLLWVGCSIAVALVGSVGFGADEGNSGWNEKETRLANEYLSLLVEQPESGRVVDLLWDLYAQHDATALLLENIKAQTAASRHPSVLLVEALLLRKNGDLKTAAERCDEVLKSEPENRFAMRTRADLATDLKQTDPALTLLKCLAEILPTEDVRKSDAWMEYGSVALNAGRNLEAADAWEAAARLKPKDLILARQVAQFLLQAGFPDRAAAFFEGLTQQADPQQRLEALYDLARIHSHADQFQKADEAVTEALGMLHFRDGRYGDFFQQRVRLHERFGALDELKNKLLIEGRKQPPVERAYSDLVTFFGITVDVDERLHWLRELTKIAPDTDEYRWLLVRALLDHEGAAEAAALIDDKLRGNGKDVPAVVLLRCEADLRLGKPADASARLKELLVVRPGDPEVEKPVLAFAQEKALDEVIETILRARVSRQPEKPETVFELATHYKSRRNLEGMDKALKTFVSEAPNAEVKQRRLNDVAAFLMVGSDVEAAVIAAKTAVDSPAAGREEWVRLAELLTEQGETEEAVKLLEQAWTKSQTPDERMDVDERLLAVFVGELKKDPEPDRQQSSGFQIPAILSGAGFASDAEEMPKKDAVTPAVLDYANKLMKGASEGPVVDERVMRAAWWAYRADLIDESYRMLRRLVFDAAGKVRKDLPLEVDQLLLDVSMAGQDTARMERQLRILASRDPTNRVRYLLRLSELVMEGSQKAEIGLQSSGWRGEDARQSAMMDAVKILEQAARENPEHEMVLSALAQCYMLMREPEKALQVWESAARKSEGIRAVPMLTRQAELLLKLQRVQEFVDVQVSIVELESDVKRRRELFQSFLERLLFTDASGGELQHSVLKDRLTLVETAVRKRVQRHPFDGFYHEALAQVHERRGEPTKAFAEMKQAYYTAPDTPFSLDQLRAAALRVGDLKSAVYFQKQIASAASDKEVAAESRQLVQLLEQTFQISEADRVRRRLESRFSQDANALLDLAGHYRSTGQDEAERRVYEQIVKVRPWEARARLRLALKCLSIADDAAAERHLRELIATTPVVKTAQSIERWPLPISDMRKSKDAGPVSEIIEQMSTSTGGLESAEVDRLRAWLSFPRPEFLELPDDASLVRLRALEELSILLRERGGADRAAWIKEWSAPKSAPLEQLWALYYAGADFEFRPLLKEVLKKDESLPSQFAYAWLLLRSHGMTEAIEWVTERRRSDAVLRMRSRIFVACVSMLASLDSAQRPDSSLSAKDRPILSSRRSKEGFRFESGELSLFGASKIAAHNVMLEITRKLEDRQRYEEALALGESLRSQASGLAGDYAFLLSRVAESAERWDLQRHYLEKATQTPLNSESYGGIYDPFVLTLGSLARVSASSEEKGELFDRSWNRLRQTPLSPLTQLRKTAVAGLAGASERAADELEGFVNGDLISSLRISEPTGVLMPPGTSRNDEAMHLHSFWEETREIGASLVQQGLGEVTAELDERLDKKWGGAQLGPRGGFQFNDWRMNMLMRRMGETNYPNRLRLIRQHLASVEMRSESSVDTLGELGGRLESGLFYREAISVFRLLPERAPTNSDYANSVLRACINAQEIEPGKSFALQLLLAEPPFKPVSIGDETMRENHALFLARDHAVEELQKRGFLTTPSKTLQGRIPPEVPYLRELGLLMERYGEDARALAAWERMHAAFVDNADMGLAPDEENCLHRARLLEKQGNNKLALAALRDVTPEEPLSQFAADILKLRGKLAASEGLWDEVRELMIRVVELKSVEGVLSLAGDLHRHGRTADALSFLTQGERTLKGDAERFRLRFEQLRLLATDKSWNPERSRPQIASLFRASTRDRVWMDKLANWLSEEALGPHAKGWLATLGTEVKSGADRPLAAVAYSAFAALLPDGSVPSNLLLAWKQAGDPDRVCLDVSSKLLLDCKRPAWAWQACQTAAEIPSARLQGRKLPIMAQVAAAMEDRHAMMELFSDVVRMPFPGGNQTVEWAKAFEDAGELGLARELFECAMKSLHQRQIQQPEVLKAWIEFSIRHHQFEAAESALVADSYLIISDAARLAFELYRDWDKLSLLDSELPKFYFPGGVEKEIRFLAKLHGNPQAARAISPDP